MRVKNNEKERIKSYLRSDIQSSITNLMHESNTVQQMLAQLSQTVAGLPSGSDQDLTDRAQQALQHISRSVQHLHQAYNWINRLDTTEVIPDEQY